MVRLASVEHQGRTKLVAELVEDGSGGGYCDLSSIATDAKSFFRLGAVARQKAQALLLAAATTAASSSSSSATVVRIPAEACRLLTPIDGQLVGKLLCIGMNYVDHCREQNVPIPTEPLVFSKFGSCIVGPGDPIAKDDHTEQLDYEVELGVVIGHTIPRHVTKEQILQNYALYIGGYTVIHDVSARDWQMHRNGGQWLLGKAGDGYAPLGPVIVTSDEFTLERAHTAGIRCRVNGETLQNSNTNQLVFQVPDILCFLSRFMTLHAGDIIATGTPPGVGVFRKPTPRFLQPGDVVECEIDGIGTLANPIVIGAQQQSPSKNLSQPWLGRLQGMTAIVTGAARGIGYGIAARLAMEGATRVAVIDVDSDSIDSACQQLQAMVPSCHFTGYACDVGDYAAVAETWQRVASQDAAAAGGSGNNRIDILVQAAGIVGATNLKTEHVDPDNFDQVFRVNIKGIFNGAKAVLPYMRQHGFGRIINIASVAGKEGNAGMLAYSSSKAAVIGLTKTIGKEYADIPGCDITCNAVAPAVIRTQMVEDMPPEQVKYMTDKIPMKRCGTIQEIAAMIAFIASPEASFTTGFCFDATGGRSTY